ncbi:MAG: hypothetical protein JSS95_00165 [Acidobacteria bacterium]|nr:hypothetical protein [Acidobacteriota bacterium]
MILSTVANAQTGIYGTVTGGHLGDMKPPYPYTGSYGFWTAGGTFGLYNDFGKFGPIHLGLDARGSILNTHQHKISSGLGGVRVAFKPPVLPLRPYVQGSVGVGSTNFGAGSITKSGFLYQALGGLDVAFFPHVDWRAVEVGGGALHINGNNLGLFTVSTGVVFRIR